MHKQYSLPHLLDPKFQLAFTKNYKLKITLINDDVKGICVFATKTIKKDEVISHYKITVFDEETYESPTNFTYTFAVFSKHGDCDENLIGDIDSKSFPPPVNNIPYWGCFTNEPSLNQNVNAIFNPNIKHNSKKCANKKYKLLIGDTITYNIQALRNIHVGEEILVYYGDEYERNYEINISDDEKELCDFTKK